MPGSDFLRLDPADVLRGRRAQWLADAVRRAVLSGELPAGTRIPPSRVLAEELGLSRGTVAEAYRRLTEEALMVGRPGAGSVVADVGPARSPSAPPAHEPAPEDAVLDLATGLPDLAAFPRAAWLRAEREVLATASARQLGYAPPAGVPELRRELAAWLTRSRGVVAAEDRLIVTGGVTGALSLLAQVLRDDGVDTVALEDPGAEGNRRILEYWLPGTTPVPVDDEGLVVGALADAPAVLVTPAHQYPTGVVLSPGRRRELVAWAEDGRLVVEDDYDAEYRYDRRPVRALQPLAPGSVAYTTSLSKTLAPGLRMGWLVPPARLYDRLVELRWATDLGSPALPQLTLAHLLRSGTLEKHLRTMRSRHRARRDACVAALLEHRPGARIGGIAAGLHLVLPLADGVDDAAVAAAARAAGVAVQPLSKYRSGPGEPGLVVHYAAHQPAVLRSAMGTLARFCA